jgi:hypothetical protein
MMLGITVLVNGKPVDPETLTYNSLRSHGQSNRTWLKRALDWAETQSKTEKWAHLDLSKVAAGGQSCGGFEAAVMSQDPRVKTVGIFNSGSFDFKNLPKLPPGVTLPKLPAGAPNMDGPKGDQFNIPAFFFIGGPTDIAYENVSASCKHFVVSQLAHLAHRARETTAC